MPTIPKLLHSPPSRGFTLIEIISVIVILAVVAAMGSSFIVSSTESYIQTQQRAKLINRSRQALEQMSRQLRDALPNSVRATTGGVALANGVAGQCVEFLPVAAAATYLPVSPTTELPDANNDAPGIAAINTAPFVVDFGTARFAAVAPLLADEVYGVAPVSLAALNATLAQGTAANSITLAGNTFWQRNSVRQRIYLAGSATAFCLEGTNLRVYSGFGTSIPLGFSPADNSGDLMAENVTAAAFTVANGAEDFNTVVTLNLTFSEGGESVNFVQQVMVRNVP